MCSMCDSDELQEATSSEVATALRIILAANSHKVPVLRGKGASKDTAIRDAQIDQFALMMATKLREHLRCFEVTSSQWHSIS